MSTCSSSAGFKVNERVVRKRKDEFNSYENNNVKDGRFDVEGYECVEKSYAKKLTGKFYPGARCINNNI